METHGGERNRERFRTFDSGLVVIDAVQLNMRNEVFSLCEVDNILRVEGQLLMEERKTLFYYLIDH